VLEEAFQLDLAFKTPDLIAHELLSPSLPLLKRLGLLVVELPGPRVLEIVEMAAKYHRPSRPDLSALVLARWEGAILLTGDKALRAAADEEGIEGHGVLWLLDRMVDRRVLSGSKATAALRRMLKDGSRLPPSDCDRYIEAWRTFKP